MKGIRILYSVLVGLLLLTSCNKEGAGCFTKAGEPKTITMTVPAYTIIDVASNVDVLLLADGPDEVQVTTGENLLSGISLEVKDGVLNIDNLNTCFWSIGYTHPLVTIRNANLVKVIQHGYGKVYSNDTLTMDNLSLLVEDASGSIDLLLKTNSVHVVSNNIGPIKLKGITQRFYAGYYWCDGILYAKDLVSSSCEIDHNGSNRLELNVINLLEGQMTNNGDVYLFGQLPAEEKVAVTGKGRIINEY